ncbi:MAG: leucyl aminopeptidase family protein [Bradymonadia bacterium]
MAMPELLPVEDAAGALVGNRFDAVVVVQTGTPLTALPVVQALIDSAAAVDARVGQAVVLIPSAKLPGGRLVVAPTGNLDRDYDDVRRFADAARAGITRAREAGARRPLFVIGEAPEDEDFTRAAEAACLGALAGLWAPLEAREALGEDKSEPVASMGVALASGGDPAAVCSLVESFEAGRRLARDIGGSEPERMRPEKVAELCASTFSGGPVKVTIIREVGRLREEYPLLMAVARASVPVERHRPCVIRLEYAPEGPVSTTLLLAGKGVTYDTGGADLKTGGHMAGMSRDKGGAAAVAGFMKVVSELKPAGVKVIAELGMVRNSIGADAFVADEIIRGHSGVRVRIGNTDAEGRLVLADLLSHLRAESSSHVAPHLFTVATLTGHAGRAMGPYSIAMDNGPARAEGVATALQATGETWGDPFELSRLRREDFDFVAPRTSADDVISCNNAPSTGTPRGHQFPMAFLAIASGVDRHGIASSDPIPYTHLDLGGSGCEGGDWQHGRPTAAPVVALAARYLI